METAQSGLILVLTQEISYSYCMRTYRQFNHTADIGIEITGKTKKDLFANAISAMFDLMIEEHKQTNANISVSEHADKSERILMIEGRDLEDLLINFLREGLYLFNGEGWLVKACEILECDSKKIVTRLKGERLNRRKYSIKTELKAVTYSGLSIKKLKAGWRAKVIFDV